MKLKLLLFFIVTLMTYANGIAFEEKEENKATRKSYMDYMEIENKVSVAAGGEYEYQGEKYDSEENFSISSETLYKIENKVKFGLGAAAKFRGRMKTDSGKTFIYDSLPIYLTYRFFPIKFKNTQTFIKFDYGFSFNHSDETSRGKYYAGGFGIEVLDTWVYDLIYEKSEGEYLGEKCSQEIIGVGIGYKIKF